MAIYEIDWDNRYATFGRFMIGEDWAIRKRYASEAVMLAANFAFKEWDLSLLRLQVYARNAVAKRLYEKIGFVVESERDGVVSMSKKRENVI